MIDLSGPMVTIVTSLIALLMGTRLAESKALRERVWDRRAVAYSTLTAALREMSRHLSTVAEDELIRFERPVDDAAARWAAYGAARATFNRTVDEHVWLLSLAAQNVLTKLEANFDRRHANPYEDYESGAVDCSHAFRELARIAQAEMLPWSWHRFKRNR